MAIVKLTTFFFLLILLIRRCACLKSCCQACSCASESWLASFLTGCRREMGLMLRKCVVREMSVSFHTLPAEIPGNYSAANS